MLSKHWFDFWRNMLGVLKRCLNRRHPTATLGEAPVATPSPNVVVTQHSDAWDSWGTCGTGVIHFHIVLRCFTFHIVSHRFTSHRVYFKMSRIVPSRCKASNIRRCCASGAWCSPHRAERAPWKGQPAKSETAKPVYWILLTVLTGLFAVILLLYAVMNSSFRSMMFYECYTVVSWSDCFSTEIQHGFNVVLPSSCVLRWFRALYVLYRFSMALSMALSSAWGSFERSPRGKPRARQEA